jgi:hypothetical protein
MYPIRGSFARRGIMKRQWFTAAITIAGMAFISASARAAIMNGSGSVHCSAQATVLVQVNDNPPDATFIPPATGANNHASASTSATIMGLGFQSCSAFVNATVSALSGIHVDVTANLQSTGVGIPVATASGSVTFTETSNELVIASLTHTGSGGPGSWDLKDSSSATILSGAGSVTLAPGTYTLQWSSPPTGTGTPTTSYALVPEPTAAAGAVLTAALSLILRRRRR